jgi:hypothetical protein
MGERATVSKPLQLFKSRTQGSVIELGFESKMVEVSLCAIKLQPVKRQQGSKDVVLLCVAT